MSTPLPTLNGLQMFEAAARHLSVTRAAEELNVTQTAVSHQIRRLEEQLGVRLFVRLNRDSGITIILVTHENDIAAYGRRMVRFRDGSIISDEATR